MQTNDALFPTTTLPKALAPAAEQAQQRLSEALSQADNIASMTKQPLPSSSWEALAPARNVKRGKCSTTQRQGSWIARPAKKR